MRKRQGLVRLDILGKSNKFIHFIWSQTHDLTACNIMPQPTMLPRALSKILNFYISYTNGRSLAKILAVLSWK
jgi:hypothetical protein